MPRHRSRFRRAIVDVGLPDIDGYDVARRIRANLNGHFTLIALTGYGQPEDRRRALAAGFDVHLVEPVALDRLDQATATAAARQPSAPTHMAD